MDNAEQQERHVKWKALIEEQEKSGFLWARYGYISQGGVHIWAHYGASRDNKRLLKTA